MFGAQQIRAYKTIMKTPRHLPRHPEPAVRLIRIITWGAVVLLGAFVAAVTAAGIASFDYTSEPVALGVVPIGLTLLFSWWFIDAAPVVSRWLVMIVALTSLIGCVAFALVASFWEQLQFLALIIYLALVSREAQRQLRTIPKHDRGPYDQDLPSL